MNTTLDAALTKFADKTRAAGPILQLRRENAQLREQLAKLAALVDHYYGAYCEAKSLVERRERELAELRRCLDSKPTPLRP
jgi:hypothetical protein